MTGARQDEDKHGLFSSFDLVSWIQHAFQISVDVLMSVGFMFCVAESGILFKSITRIRKFHSSAWRDPLFPVSCVFGLTCNLKCSLFHTKLDICWCYVTGACCAKAVTVMLESRGRLCVLREISQIVLILICKLVIQFNTDSVGYIVGMSVFDYFHDQSSFKLKIS